MNHCEVCSQRFQGPHYSAPDCNETGIGVVLCAQCAGIYPNDAPETYRIHVENLAPLNARVEKFNRRAARHGFEPVAVEIVGEDIVPIIGDDGKPSGRVNVFALLEVRGECPKVEGFELIARIEHTEAGNIIARAPSVRGDSCDFEAYRTADAQLCDHCHTRRARIDTFLVREIATGKLSRVGRNCLADFVRSADAAEAIRIWKFLYSLNALNGSDPEGSGGSFRGYPALVDFVAHVARAIELHGWVSRRVAFEQNKTSTKERAIFTISPCPTFGPPLLRHEWREGQPSAEHFESAKAAIEWAKSNPETGEFAENLRVVCSLDYVKPKNEGIAAAVIVCQRRAIAREEARTRPAPVSRSEHFGAVGSRYVRRLTVSSQTELAGDYGLTVLYAMADEHGNRFKWFASGHALRPEGEWLENGDSFDFAFTVKRHGDFRGTAETQITRAVALAVEPSAAFRWIREDTGEIFKTKKALRESLQGNLSVPTA